MAHPEWPSRIFYVAPTAKLTSVAEVALVYISLHPYLPMVQ